MKVYFTASLTDKKAYLDIYQKIVTLLKKNRCNVLTNHFHYLLDNGNRAQDKQNRINYQQKLEKMINISDLIIAETSLPSVQVGYEISLANYAKKRVLILYSNRQAPNVYKDLGIGKTIFKKYTVRSLDKIIDEFINLSKTATGIRFNFFITSEIASFLKKVSTKYNLPQSVYLRHLIEKDMKDRNLS